MIRKLIPFLLLAGLTACAPTGSQRSSSASSSTSSSASDPANSTSTYSNPVGTGTTCDAESLQALIGKKATPAVIEDARTRSHSTTARLLRPGQVVTMEYNNVRLNLIVDDKDVLQAIRCG